MYIFLSKSVDFCIYLCNIRALYLSIDENDSETTLRKN